MKTLFKLSSAVGTTVRAAIKPTVLSVDTG